ncbi:PLD nuclease N-terminal domain-containing protein [Corynebacterium sp. A21]|uniref:PLD nuclease N-terminal domain-containing protein n=1 Tax=Corynebacterium sp. A21 TaxID=3457318 RepID=UPI003FD5ABA2
MDDLIRYLQKNVHEQRRELQRRIGRKGERALIVGVVLELATKVATWVSLARRSRDEVRGPKWVWALGAFLNGIGPATYLFVGRK